ncbi:MAG: tRNA (uridine(34)/cytosine(34)/5-carboxymethylaminomethyluridine(34)-2'-O)-methyltransferase TrmL [Clostridiales bacterium]|nr:tRNA (uridine(34)/cytosine(34)/5-carboxymethylaminomethyluridine(34)-2'-O)-methyltransferase TrmL [Clostridiales bacterium]MCF8021657.1 tRNA (uridine(34)/cytosine(34)/5-carboxymethylaminomethyluridine(34)-2'-O)-methyltransferase TrmL [Clostridiales bacterium]
MHVVLVEPEIPGNTGNIARTCSVTGTGLHLVKPLGFNVDDAHLKRAGLDYWYLLNIHYHENIQEVFRLYPYNNFYFISTKGESCYTEAGFYENDFLVFGKETAGLPAWIISKYRKNCLRIPMLNNVRSLNLSNSVSIVLYECLRQTGFKNMY